MNLQVDSVHGTISLKQTINYTEFPNMTFTVLAQDGGDPPLTDTATVFIQVLEINTHRPRFTPDFHNLEIRADAEPGTRVLTLIATDLDSGEWSFSQLQAWTKMSRHSQPDLDSLIA